MASKRVVSERRRSRPITKHKSTHKLKRNKPAMALVIIIILMLVFSTFYVVFTSFSGTNTSNNGSTTSGYQNDSDYINALAGTDYPVALLELSKEKAIAIELYNDEMPVTCQNFINLVKNGFYDGMIFHRVMDGFMIQAGKSYPDGSTSISPYGNIIFEESNIKHVDGAISMASTGAKVGGSAEFFICDGEQPGLDGNYAAFGKTIYGIEYVREIADEPHDGSYGAVGGGKPYNDIIINSIRIVKE